MENHSRVTSGLIKFWVAGDNDRSELPTDCGTRAPRNCWLPVLLAKLPAQKDAIKVQQVEEIPQVVQLSQVSFVALSMQPQHRLEFVQLGSRKAAVCACPRDVDG